MRVCAAMAGENFNLTNSKEPQKLINSRITCEVIGALKHRKGQAKHIQASTCHSEFNFLASQRHVQHVNESQNRRLRCLGVVRLGKG